MLKRRGKKKSQARFFLLSRCVCSFGRSLVFAAQEEKKREALGLLGGGWWGGGLFVVFFLQKRKRFPAHPLARAPLSRALFLKTRKNAPPSSFLSLPLFSLSALSLLLSEKMRKQKRGACKESVVVQKQKKNDVGKNKREGGGGGERRRKKGEKILTASPFSRPRGQPSLPPAAAPPASSLPPPLSSGS